MEEHSIPSSLHQGHDLSHSSASAPPNLAIVSCFFRLEKAFWTAMQETDSILLSPQLFTQQDIPASLTILTPTQAGNQLYDFFQAQGYEEHGTETGSVFSRNHYRIWQETIEVATSLSPKALLYTALLKRSGTTDELCFLTGKYLVCICPQLTSRKKYAFVHNYKSSIREEIKKNRRRTGFSLAEGDDKQVAELYQERFIGDSYCQIWEICPKEVLSPDIKAIEDRQAAIAGFDTGWKFRLRKLTNS
jgi:hypothetical protein